MNDTSPEVEKKIIEMFQQKTPSERLEMACSMYETSKQLVIRYILENNPQISKGELRREFFLKFYGDDFDPVTRGKIAQYLENVPSE